MDEPRNQTETLSRALTVTRSFYFCSFSCLIALAWSRGWGILGAVYDRESVLKSWWTYASVCPCLFVTVSSYFKWVLHPIYKNPLANFYTVWEPVMDSHILWVHVGADVFWSLSPKHVWEKAPSWPLWNIDMIGKLGLKNVLDSNLSNTLVF